MVVQSYCPFLKGLKGSLTLVIWRPIPAAPNPDSHCGEEMLLRGRPTLLTGTAWGPYDGLVFRRLEEHHLLKCNPMVALCS